MTGRGVAHGSVKQAYRPTVCLFGVWAADTTGLSFDTKKLPYASRHVDIKLASIRHAAGMSTYTIIHRESDFLVVQTRSDGAKGSVASGLRTEQEAVDWLEDHRKMLDRIGDAEFRVSRLG
jgi:hypothetical protein